MQVIDTGQILTLAAFLAALALVWFLVHRHRAALSGRLQAGRRMRLVETLPLSPVDRATILQVDGRDFLILRMKGAAPVVHPLAPEATP